MRVLVAFLAVSMAAVAYSEFVDMTFDEYIVKYEKAYTGAEYRLRHKLFNERVAEIKAHNSRVGVTSTRGINHFTDQTDHELSKMLGLNKISHYARASVEREPESPLTPRLRKALADEVDWVKKGATTPVKNQLGCGSCWAFAGTESLESCAFIGSNKLVTLAPQEFVDCVENKEKCGGTGGCQGAIPDLMFEYAKTAGAVAESDYPYVARDEKCQMSSKKAIVKVGGYVDVANNDYQSLLDAANGQPVTVGVAANSFFSYSSGVLAFDDCDADVNHAVLLVGYGTDADLGDYWKIQNSWGPSWGERGFIRLARSSSDSTNCKVDTTPLDGFGCQGGPANVTICGTCGVLYGASYPTGCSVV